MDLGIAGRRAAVAGASAGLGFATAAALVAEGVKVAVCSRDKERIEKAAAQLGPDAVPLVADVSSAEGGAAFVRAAREALGGLDILVPNTGGPPPGNFATTSVEAYQDAIDLNLLSTIGMCREAVPGMQEQKWGRVVAITSIGVRQPIGALAASVTARTGVTGFLKVMATEVAPDGVTVNSLQPGLHATDRVEKLSGGNTEALAASVPAGFLGRAEDFGQIAAFLCSEHARFLTGCGIHVDGGAYTALL
jgi:3-oxoacyl-[acyl-carrier protein] reductase